MTNPNPLNPVRVSEKIRHLTEDSQMMMGTVSDRLNAVAFERAIQAGYVMACEDLGAAPPAFIDPMQTLVNNLAGKGSK
jgi:hypothetical protein